jgi:aryl-alcohol dehydrogenase-like predicted oxidoreductase
LVIATKYSLLARAGDPNSAGNHRKSMIQSVETSLRRLGTDYIDLLYLHIWDGRTPVEEVMRAFDDLVRAGKVLYAGISDTPAWQIARMQTVADLRGFTPLVALQVEYSLVQRTAERDLMPMARELGLGVLPWSPLAGGVLSGKYTRADLKGESTTTPSGTRQQVAVAHGMLNARALDIADVVKDIARESGHSPSQIALAWTMLHPAVTSPIIGARTFEQFEDNLGALEVIFTPEQRERLARASAFELGFPHEMLQLDIVKQVMTGGLRIESRA